MKESDDELIAEIILFSNENNPNDLRLNLDDLRQIVMKDKLIGEYTHIVSLLKKIVDDIYIVDFDYWVLVEYGNAMYELREYNEALEIAYRYMKIEPNDPYCIFHYSLILRANKEPSRAINYLKKILNKSLEELSYGQFGDGIREAKTLINDTRYLLALTYFEEDNLKKSLELYNKHLENRQRGISSMVTKKTI